MKDETLNNELLDSDEPVEPCSCFIGCKYDCKGECGCQHCADAYADFLSMREE